MGHYGLRLNSETNYFVKPFRKIKQYGIYGEPEKNIEMEMRMSSFSHFLLTCRHSEFPVYSSKLQPIHCYMKIVVFYSFHHSFFCCCHFSRSYHQFHKCAVEHGIYVDANGVDTVRVTKISDRVKTLKGKSWQCGNIYANVGRL